jgi:putative serine protease PepD
MKRFTRPLAVAGLIATGAFADRALAGTPPATGVAAAATTAAKTASTSLETATEYAFAVASPSVVYVDSVGVGTGSGVIYDSSGDIVTNAHVLSGATTITVTLSNGKTYTATLVGTDTADDLAVIHIKASGLHAARFAAAGTVQVAQTALAIGSPLGLQESVTSGLVSALNRTVQESNGAYLPNALQTSAAINPGNSGGALVNLAGTVIGIPTLQATDSQNNNGGAAQGIGFAIPSSRVTFIAHQIITTGTVAHTGRASLGVSAADSSAQTTALFAQSSSPTIAGAVVTQVADGSPAARAGITQGDVITKLAGRTVTSENDLLAALAAQKPATTVAVTLERAGASLTVHVRLGELSAS